MSAQGTLISGARLADLVLRPDVSPRAGGLRLGEYGDFLDTLTGRGGVNRSYQADAARSALGFCFSGRYDTIEDLIGDAWDHDPAYTALRAHYGTRARHEELATFPGKLAATLDLATAAGKSFVMYAIARIALNEGLVSRVLILCPGVTIREGLEDKFSELLADAALNDALPARPGGVSRPDLVRATGTVGTGSICIENRDQIWSGSALRDSFDGTGDDTLVLNDETHHVYDDDGDATRWHQWLAHPANGFRRIIGVSGTPFAQKRKPPFDYFADVIYRLSLRQAMDLGVTKSVQYVDSISGSQFKAGTALYQKAIWKFHLGNRQRYSKHGIKPLTIVVAQDIKAMEKAAADFTAEVASMSGGDPGIAEKILCVSSDKKHASNRAVLKRVDDPANPVEIIFSVAMLTEGWDAKNVFLVVPHQERAFNSHLLIAQVLGRGLRLPSVSGGPTPKVIVLNHDAWAPKVKQLVADLVDMPEKVDYGPHATAHAAHFALDHLHVTSAASIVQETYTPELVTAADDLRAAGVDLAPQVAREQIAIALVGITGNAADEQEIRIDRGSLLPLENVVDDLYRQLRMEAQDDAPRLRAIDDAGPEAVRDLISASLRRSGLTGAAAAGLTPPNVVRIRKALLACFPPGGSVQLGLPTERTRNKLIRVEETRHRLLSTEGLRYPAATLDRLRDNHTTIYFSKSALTGLDDASTRNLSTVLAERATSHSVAEVDDTLFRTPVSLCVVRYNPERGFVQRLTRLAVAERLTAWIKAPDTGFYGIRWTPRDGAEAGNPKTFNPDFFLYLADAAPRGRVLIVETKDNGDASDENRDKVAAAEKYVADLNSELAGRPDRPEYSFHLLAPDDYLDFCTALEAGTAHTYVGGLHQQLRSLAGAADAGEETSSGDPLQALDAALGDVFGEET